MFPCQTSSPKQFERTLAFSRPLARCCNLKNGKRRLRDRSCMLTILSLITAQHDKGRVNVARWSRYSPHVVNSAQFLDDEAGCRSLPLFQESLVKPNVTAAAFCSAVRVPNFLSGKGGCFSLPESLSHETWVKPSTRAADLSPLQPAKREFSCISEFSSRQS